MLKKLQYGALLLLTLFSLCCDAPRNNPLDPIIVHTASVDSFWVYSSVVYSLGNKTRYQIFVKAKISDEYHTVDEVFVEVPNFKVKKKLNYNINEDIYEYALSLTDFRTEKIEEIVGHEFRLVVNNQSSAAVPGKTDNVKRIIYNEIEPVSPLNSDTVYTNTPTLKWMNLNLGFKFHYLVEVYLSGPSITPEWQKTFSSTETSATVDVPLPPDEYNWVVWCVDQFDNRSRSKNSRFLIINKK